LEQFAIADLEIVESGNHKMDRLLKATVDHSQGVEDSAFHLSCFPIYFFADLSRGESDDGIGPV